jgi:hypothetical protein
MIPVSELTSFILRDDECRACAYAVVESQSPTVAKPSWYIPWVEELSASPSRTHGRWKRA